MFLASMYSINSNYTSRIVCISNPHSEYNIKKFIKDNNINVEFLNLEIIVENGRKRIFVWLKCNKDGHIWKTTFPIIRKGHRCYMCDKNQRKSDDEIIEIKNDIYMYLKKYNFEIVEFNAKSVESRFFVKDLEGYIYKTTLINLRNGCLPLKFHCGNPYSCYNIQIYLNKNNSNIKIITEGYTNNEEFLEFRCDVCGNSFKRKVVCLRINDLKCTHCIERLGAFSGIRADKHKIEWQNLDAILYFINIYNDSENFYKIGITTRCIEDRFNKLHKSEYNYNVEYVIKINLYLASKTEYCLLNKFKHKKYKPLNKFTGYTECFNDIDKEYFTSVSNEYLEELRGDI